MYIFSFHVLDFHGVKSKGCECVCVCGKGQKRVCHTQCVKVGTSVIYLRNVQAKVRLILAPITAVLCICHDTSHLHVTIRKLDFLEMAVSGRL